MKSITTTTAKQVLIYYKLVGKGFKTYLSVNGGVFPVFKQNDML